MRVLVCGFRGNTNSAKLVLDRIECGKNMDKLYFINSFKGSQQQLEEKLKEGKYDLIVAFGQKPKVREIYLEEKACVDGEELMTSYDYGNLIRYFESEGISFEKSCNAGRYLCNYIYYRGLKFIKENGMKSEMVFIHVPSIKNIEDIDKLGKIFSKYLSN